MQIHVIPNGKQERATVLAQNDSLQLKIFLLNVIEISEWVRKL